MGIDGTRLRRDGTPRQLIARTYRRSWAEVRWPTMKTTEASPAERA
jgi:hypothetical protein